MTRTREIAAAGSTDRRRASVYVKGIRVAAVNGETVLSPPGCGRGRRARLARSGQRGRRPRIIPAAPYSKLERAWPRARAMAGSDPRHMGNPADVTVVASASGTRIDCDRCGEHTSSPDLTRDQLRRATGYTCVDGRDLCPDCAASDTTPRDDRGAPHNRRSSDGGAPPGLAISP